MYIHIIGASVSESPLVDSTDGLSRYICHDIYIYTSGTRYCACAALRANVAGRIGNRVSPAESAFQPASDRDRVSPAESAFLVPRHNAMMMIDFKREGDALFRHLQGS